MRAPRASLLVVGLLAAGCNLLVDPEFQGGGAPSLRDSGLPVDSGPTPTVDAGTVDGGPKPVPPTYKFELTGGEIGASCTNDNDAQCKSRNCSLLSSLRLVDGDDTWACVTACGSDSDCPGGTYCWNGGSGVKLCVSPTLVGLSYPAIPSEGACSADPGGSCRSGQCSMGQCVENCNHDGACDGSSCRAATIDRCIKWSNGTCTKMLSGFVQFACGEDGTEVPCRTSADCPAGTPRCDYVQKDVATHTEWLKACVAAIPGATKNEGDACGDHNECKSGYCIGTTPPTGMKYCSSSCSTDSDCSGKRRCRVVRRTNNAGVDKDHWYMVCEAAPN